MMMHGCESVKRVVAPMVGQSDAPFRSLCLKYGATCVYSEMLYSDRIINDENYLDSYLPSCDHDFISLGYSSRPLVAQICGNDPGVVGQAARIVAASGRVDAVDFNLGCPQDRARDGLYGSYLLDRCHWPKVFACVSAAINELKPLGVPFFCKIRLLEGSDILHTTKEFCKGLYDAGVRVLCIHGRTRGSARRRRCGPADLQTIGAVASYMQHYHAKQSHYLPNDIQRGFTVIANGNIISPIDISRNIETVARAMREAECEIGGLAGHCLVCEYNNRNNVWWNGCVMSGEGILSNPSLFCSALGKEADKDESAPSLLTLFQEYCSLSEAYREMGGWDGLNQYRKDTSGWDDESRQMYYARQHLRWMLGKTGHGRTVRFVYKGDDYKKHTQLLTALKDASTIDELLYIAGKCLPSH